MADQGKLIEMDDKVTRSKEWRPEYYVKEEELEELEHISFYDDPTCPRCIVHGCANSGSETCIFGMPPGKVVIG